MTAFRVEVVGYVEMCIGQVESCSIVVEGPNVAAAIAEAGRRLTHRLMECGPIIGDGSQVVFSGEIGVKAWDI